MAAVTLQLGHYAGCVGAHWWGLQAAGGAGLSAAALRREAPGAPPTPRLVALELKGGVGALGAGGRREAAPEVTTWRGDVATYQDGGRQRGDAAREAEGGSGTAACGAGAVRGPAQLWSEYLPVPLHPHSLLVLPQYNHDGDAGRLKAFGQGEQLLQEPWCLEELDDRLHFFVEECDYLQGFQVLCDLHDGFSGVGAKVTELLHDEYSRKGILTWGLTPVIHRAEELEKEDFYRLMNTALGLVHLSSQSSLFCPLSLNSSLGLRPEPPIAFPYINYDASLDYHSSAILAAALDTLSAPYRLSASPCSMLHLAEALTFSGRKVVAALAAVPFPLVHGHSLLDTLRTQQQALPWKLLSAGGEQQVSRCFAQSVVLRGICKESPSSRCPGNQPAATLHAGETEEEVLQHYLQTLFPGAFSTCHVLEQPCSTLPPYPQFFSPLLTKQGLLLDKPLGSSSTAVESIPVAAALQSAPVLHTVLHGLYKELRGLDVRRWAAFFSAGVEEEEFREALHDLRTLAECYKTHLEADESEDETDSD
ncbi:protein misato homolog 1 [Eudromia elegans]